MVAKNLTYLGTAILLIITVIDYFIVAPYEGALVGSSVLALSVVSIFMIMFPIISVVINIALINSTLKKKILFLIFLAIIDIIILVLTYTFVSIILVHG